MISLKGFQEAFVPKKLRKFPIATFTERNHLPRNPSTMTCLNCLMPIKRTIKQGYINSQTHVVAALMTPMLLTWAPYAFRFAKDVIHRCPFCRVQLGVTEFRMFGMKKYPREKHIKYTISPKGGSGVDMSVKKPRGKKIVIQDSLEKSTSSDVRTPARNRGEGSDETSADDDENDILCNSSIEDSSFPTNSPNTLDVKGILQTKRNKTMTTSVESSIYGVHMKPVPCTETKLEQLLEEGSVGRKAFKSMTTLHETNSEEATRNRLPMQNIHDQDNNIEPTSQIQETVNNLAREPPLAVTLSGFKVTQHGSIESRSADTVIAHDATKHKFQEKAIFALQSHSHPTANNVAANRDVKPKSYSPDTRHKLVIKGMPNERKSTTQEHRLKKSPHDRQRHRPGEKDAEEEGPPNQTENHKRKHVGKTSSAEGDDTKTKKSKIVSQKLNSRKDGPEESNDVVIAHTPGENMNFIVPGSLVTHSIKDNLEYRATKVNAANAKDISQENRKEKGELVKLHEETVENSRVPWETSRIKANNYPELLKRARKLDNDIARSIGGPSFPSLAETFPSNNLDQQQLPDNEAQLVKSVGPVGLHSTDVSTEDHFQFTFEAKAQTHRFLPQPKNEGTSTKVHPTDGNLEPNISQRRKHKLQRGDLTGHQLVGQESSLGSSTNDSLENEPLVVSSRVRNVYPKCEKCSRPKKSKNQDETSTKNMNS